MKNEDLNNRTHKKSIVILGTFLSWRGTHRAPGEDLAEKLEEKNWHVILSSLQLNKFFRLIDMVKTALKYRNNYSVAVIELYSNYAFIWAEIICFILIKIKKPYILVLHGGNLPEFKKKWQRRVGYIFKNASKIVAPSKFLQVQMALPSCNISVIPNPINIMTYSYRCRREAKPKLLWLRSFKNHYNPSVAPEAVALLLKKTENIKMCMIGPDYNDGSFQKTKNKVYDLKVQEHVTFIKGIEKKEVPYYLSKYDIFINTTNIDNTPVSIIEAMASGLCIVSTNVGGIPYLLENGVDSLLIPPNNPVALAEAIYRILSEPDLAESLSTKAREKAEKFSWEYILPQWESMLMEANKRNNS